ncbi:MAG: flagellar hook-basal body complex protein [Magnetococcales bacterium]|nr:flagellar hook-basal body complex protein [Magnetococcales bacterium]
MSIIQAMFAGSSALTNFGEAMTVIGNNLANSNTTAFKASTSGFEDVLIQTVGNQSSGATTQIGTGVGLADVRQNMAQGSFSATSNVTDMSIDGKGFFEVKDLTVSSAKTVDQKGLPKDTFFTRAGGFTRNKAGLLVTPGGMVLQGWQLDADGNQAAGGLSNIDLSKFVNIDPTATSLVKVGANLDASTKAKDMTAAYNPSDPSTYDFSTSVRIFDTKGTGHNVEIQFRKLPMAVPATVTAGDATTNAAKTISFDVKTPKETPFTVGQQIQVPITFNSLVSSTDKKSGTFTYTLTQADVDSGKSTNTINIKTTLAKIDGLNLTSGTRYSLSVGNPSGSSLTVANVAGDNGITEIKGVANDNTWQWHAVVADSELDISQQSGTTLNAIDTNSKNVMAAPSGAGYTTGQLVFDNSGKLLQEGSTPLTFQFAGAQAQQILFDFGDAIGTMGDSTNDFSKKTTALTYDSSLTTVQPDTSNTGANGCVQVTSGFATLRLEQNGFPPGYLDKLAISQKGEITGNFTNGQSRKLYQVALVDFDDETALEQVGSNLFAQTVASGLPRIGQPTSGRLGTVLGYSLEQSNVDMSAEFVRMITTQRGFQANSRIVTVTDGMMEELLSLKR